MDNFNLKKYLSEGRLNENENSSPLGYMLLYKGKPAQIQVEEFPDLAIRNKPTLTRTDLKYYVKKDENQVQGMIDILQDDWEVLIDWDVSKPRTEIIELDRDSLNLNDFKIAKVDITWQ